MDLRMKLIVFLFSLFLAALATIYVLTGQIYEVWLVVVLSFFFAGFFVLRIVQKYRKT